jgi:hypothetical protein
VSDLSDHYNAKRLPSATAARLLAATRRTDRRRRIVPVSAGLLLAAALLLTVRLVTTPTLLDQAAAEVATNHLKQSDLDIITGDFDDIGPALARLSFTPTASLRLEDSGLSLVGARYCTIQGHLAAQVRLIDDTGRIYTLYEVEATDALRSLEGTVEQGALEISMWQEEGLLFALASPR